MFSGNRQVPLQRVWARRNACALRIGLRDCLTTYPRAPRARAPAGPGAPKERTTAVANPGLAFRPVTRPGVRPQRFLHARPRPALWRLAWRIAWRRRAPL